MPRISRIEVLQQNEQPILSIRTVTSVDQLPRLIGESYGKLGAYLNELGECLSEVPFVAYYNMDMQHLDVEIGFPVSKTLPDYDDIKSGAIPAGKSVFCMYQGPYNEVESVYTEMAEHIQAKGYEPVGTAYEFYYNDAEFPESELLTKIVMPIKG
ncbi:MAG: GyrI-like domain-containing protein [Bacillus sp. (in: firmicutes)]